MNYWILRLQNNNYLECCKILMINALKQQKHNEQNEDLKRMILQLEHEMKQKESIRDSLSKSEKLSNQIYYQKMAFDELLKEKASLDQLALVQQDILKIQLDSALKVYQEDFEQKLQEHTQTQLQLLETRIDKQYLQKVPYQDDQQAINLQFQKLNELIKMNAQELIDQKLKFQYQIETINHQLEDKVEVAEFSKVQEQLPFFLLSTEMNGISNEWNQTKLFLDQKLQEFKDTIKQFQKFISKTDYDLLSKASKMDIELNQDKISKLQGAFEKLQNKLKSVKSCILGFSNQINDIKNEGREQIADDIYKILIPEIRVKVKEEVTNNLIEANLRNINEEINNINRKLDEKTNQSEILQIINQSPSKQLIDQFFKLRKSVQIEIFQLKQNLLKITTNLTSVLDNSLSNIKKRELNQIITGLHNPDSSRNGSHSLDYKFRQKPLIKPLMVHQQIFHPNDSSIQRRLHTQKHSSQYSDDDM